MKTVKLIRDGGSRFAILSMFALFAVTGCSAHPNNTKSSTSLAQVLTDSVMIKAIGDNVYGVISAAKKIKAEVMYFPNDSLAIPQTKEISIKSKYIPLVQFALSDPQLYGGDTNVYGVFMPTFTLSFRKSKKLYVARFDFGLHKWAIYDSKGQMLRRFDLPSDNMLRLANILFPENDIYKKLINTEKK